MKTHAIRQSPTDFIKSLFPACFQNHPLLALLLFLILLSGCKSETLLQANFEGNTINQPPLQAQKIGSVQTDGPAGSVKVVGPPPTLTGKWVQVSRPKGQIAVSALQGKLKEFRGNGIYDFTAFVYIPDGSEVVTIQFEAFNQPANDPKGFLHLDFMQDNRVRIDDSESTTFGTFPRNQVFIVKVTLDINASTPKADIVLSGAGASGEAHRDIISAFRPLAQQFGAVRLWMGLPWTGFFDATNIVVKRRTE